MNKETAVRMVLTPFLTLVLLAGAGPVRAGSSGGDDASGQSASDRSAESAGSSTGDLRQRLRALEAKYNETGHPKFMFRRVLTLEEMGEYEFALDVLQEHRGEFESSDAVDGVAVVEQRLRDATSGGVTDTSSAGGPEKHGDRVDALGWGLVAGGGASIVGGVVPLVVAESRANRLRCSPVSEGASADGCGGVDEYRGLSSSEFDRRSRSVTTLRLLGVGFTALGVGAAGWGIYRLAAGPPSRATDRAERDVGPPTLRPAVWSDGATLELRVEF